MGAGRGGIGSIAGDDPGQHAQEGGRVALRLVSELRLYGKQLIFVFALVVLGAGAQALGPYPLGPYLIGRAIDGAIRAGNGRNLLVTMLVLLAVYGVGAAAQRGQTYRVGLVGQGVLASLRNRIFTKFGALPLGYFDKNSIGSLMSRVLNDVATLNQFLSQGLTQILGSLFSLVGIVVAMLILDWRLALACLVVIPVMALLTSLFARAARQAFRTTRLTIGEVTSGLEEEIGGVREAQAFARTEENVERFRERNLANWSANVRAVAITSAFAPAVDVVSASSTALVIGFGGYLVFSGSMTVGVVAAFLIYVQQFFRPIQLIAQVYTQAQSALAGGERIYEILDETEEPPEPTDARVLADMKGEIAFEAVDFAYDADNPVLRDITFHVRPGQTVALVGPTGAGKTTIANLIPRFYDVSGGVVKVDGYDVREVTRRSLRRGIAVVLQEQFLFSGTVAENIGYGSDSSSREEVERAARAVSADGFISELPEGYDTPLGEGSRNLSQGQRQLVSFARAVLADPRILILDEATSNVDTRTEALIQQALDTLLEGRTSVVIAHRLSTVRNADLILAVRDGRIVERGTHAALLGRDGLYADLYRRQLGEPASEALEGKAKD